MTRTDRRRWDKEFYVHIGAQIHIGIIVDATVYQSVKIHSLMSFCFGISILLAINYHLYNKPTFVLTCFFGIAAFVVEYHYI